MCDMILVLGPGVGTVLDLLASVGAGRSELLRSVIGLHRVTGGEILVGGNAVRIQDMRSALWDFGIGYVTENRKEEGLLLDFAVKRNVAVTIWHELVSRFRLLTPGTEEPITSSYVECLDIWIRPRSTVPRRPTAPRSSPPTGEPGEWPRAAGRAAS